MQSEKITLFNRDMVYLYLIFMFLSHLYIRCLEMCNKYFIILGRWDQLQFTKLLASEDVSYLIRIMNP